MFTGSGLVRTVEWLDGSGWVMGGWMDDGWVGG